MTVKKRQSALEAFRKSTSKEGYRVLLLSNVGIVGLNLAFANIMIMVVRKRFVRQSLRTNCPTGHYLVCP